MSRDCLVERTERLNKILTQMSGHNVAYARRVEKIVEQVFNVKIEHLKLRSRKREFVYPRYVLFAILWQKNGFRSTGWLSKRYNIDQWTIYHGCNRVQELPDLKQKYITVMTILERDLELELFGKPMDEFLAQRQENDPVEKPRGCDTLL